MLPETFMEPDLKIACDPNTDTLPALTQPPEIDVNVAAFPAEVLTDSVPTVRCDVQMVTMLE